MYTKAFGTYVTALPFLNKDARKKCAIAYPCEASASNSALRGKIVLYATKLE